MSYTRSNNSQLLATRLVGCKYLSGGCTPSGFDCWGLVWYFLTEMGEDIPKQYDYSLRQTTKDLVMMTSEAESSGDWQPIDRPERGCIAAFSRHGHIIHVGIWLDEQRRVLHANSNNVTCETIGRIEKKRNLKAKFYKWRKLT